MIGGAELDACWVAGERDAVEDGVVGAEGGGGDGAEVGVAGTGTAPAAPAIRSSAGRPLPLAVRPAKAPLNSPT